jgi:putative tricarboxylic transport membrane protein
MKKETIAALTLFGFSLLYALGSLGLKFGSLRKPGPGFLPSVIAVALILCTSVHLFQVLRKRSRGSVSGPGSQPVNLRVVAGLGLCILVYPALLMTADFVIATFLTVLAMLLILRYKTWPLCLLVSLATALVCFIAFGVVLGLALPSGFIETVLYRLRG